MKEPVRKTILATTTHPISCKRYTEKVVVDEVVALNHRVHVKATSDILDHAVLNCRVVKGGALSAGLQIPTMHHLDANILVDVSICGRHILRVEGLISHDANAVDHRPVDVRTHAKSCWTHVDDAFVNAAGQPTSLMVCLYDGQTETIKGRKVCDQPDDGLWRSHVTRDLRASQHHKALVGVDDDAVSDAILSSGNKDHVFGVQRGLNSRSVIHHAVTDSAEVFDRNTLSEFAFSRPRRGTSAGIKCDQRRTVSGSRSCKICAQSGVSTAARRVDGISAGIKGQKPASPISRRQICWGCG